MANVIYPLRSQATLWNARHRKSRSGSEGRISKAKMHYQLVTFYGHSRAQASFMLKKNKKRPGNK